MHTIAVIGATGELGFRLVHALQQSYRIVAVVRNRGKRDFSSLPHVEIRQVHDISDIDKLGVALKGCEAVVNTGYIWFARHIHQAMVNGGLQLRHALFTGSTGIYTRLPSPSAERKREAEQFIQQRYQCPWTIIRPTMIYGHEDDRNISRLLRTIARYPILPLIGPGDSLIQPVFIHDVVKAHETALLNPKYFGKSYDIGGSKAYSNRDLIACASASLDRRTRLVSLPAALIDAAVTLLSTLRISPVSREQVWRFQEDKHIDLSPFIKDFDYVPRNFEQGIGSLVRDLKLNRQLARH